MNAFCGGTVIKVGGALIRDRASFGLLVGALESLAERPQHGPPLLIVPGGGPFADAVRVVDEQLGAGDEASHWMAILGMDQHAHLLAEGTGGADLVETMDEARSAYEDGRLPVLAPYRWLRARDPLPHSWAVTSDSIAAWIAIEVGAAELLLLKPVDGPVHALTDPYFSTVLEAAAASGRNLHVAVAGPSTLAGRVLAAARTGTAPW